MESEQSQPNRRNPKKKRSKESEARDRPVGEDLHDRERLRRGLEEGVEVGVVEVDGCVATGPARARADAERPVPRCRRVKRGGGGGENEEETRRRRHGSRRARIPHAGAGCYGIRGSVSSPRSFLLLPTGGSGI
jgi:hypothetical protein